MDFVVDLCLVFVVWFFGFGVVVWLVRGWLFCVLGLGYVVGVFGLGGSWVLGR